METEAVPPPLATVNDSIALSPEELQLLEPSSSAGQISSRTCGGRWRGRWPTGWRSGGRFRWRHGRIRRNSSGNWLRRAAAGRASAELQSFAAKLRDEGGVASTG